MSVRVRTNVAEQSVNDPTSALYWYNKAVEVMRGKDVTDPSGWGWWAAVHLYNNFNNVFWTTEYEDGRLWVTGLDGDISNEDKTFWANCPHGSFYFLAWHRQYLLAFENAVRNVINSMENAPADWALPYWDYTTSGEENMSIPTQFEDPSTALYFPNRQTNNMDFYDDTVTNTGPEAFSDYGGSSKHSGGPLEGTPHGAVHMSVNGAMALVETAGLDPLFYLHHASIDRLWSIWTSLGGEITIDGVSPYPDKAFPFKWFDNNESQVISMLLDAVSNTENIEVLDLGGNVIETISYSYDTAEGLKAFKTAVLDERGATVTVGAEFISNVKGRTTMADIKASDIETFIFGSIKKPMKIAGLAQAAQLQLLEEKTFRKTLSLSASTQEVKQIKSAKVQLEGVVTDGIPINYLVEIIELDPDTQAEVEKWNLGTVAFFGSTISGGKTSLLDGAPMPTSILIPKKLIGGICDRLLNCKHLTVKLIPNCKTKDCGVVTIEKIVFIVDSVG
jgi:hypothetical protein